MITENIIYLPINPGRLGNILFFIACKLNVANGIKEIKYFSNMKFDCDLTNAKLLNELLYNVTISGNDDIRRCPGNNFDYILDTAHCNFAKMKDIINYDYLDTLNNINLDITKEKYLCIHCRFGDYLDDYFNKTFKSFNSNILEKILNDYPEITTEYDNVIIISDNINLAKEKLNDILTNKNFKNILYSDGHSIINDFNYLLNANCIIGSCSTFSFMGCYLNKNDAKIYVEFPYYKHPNDLGFEEGKQDALYNSDKVIKIS